MAKLLKEGRDVGSFPIKKRQGRGVEKEKGRI